MAEESNFIDNPQNIPSENLNNFEDENNEKLHNLTENMKNNEEENNIFELEKLKHNKINFNDQIINENDEKIENIKNLEEKIKNLEMEKLQNEEKIINNNNENIKNLEEKLKNLDLEKLKIKDENETLNNLINNLKLEFRLKNEQLSKKIDYTKRDKDSMVLKFAQSEQKNIEFLKKVKELEGRLREKTIHVDQLNIEKEKLNKELRSRVSDYSTYEKELNNLKVSLSIAEQKLKNEDVKLKEEVEKHKELKKKFDELNRNVIVMKEENCTLRSNCQEIVKTYQDSEDMRSNSLSSSIKQIKEDLRKCIEEKKEAVDNFNKLNLELQSSKISVNNHLQEIKNIKDKLKHAEADRMCQDETIKQLKDGIKSLNFVKDQLNDRICHLEPFESQITQLSQDRSRLTASNDELKKIVDDSESLVGTLRQKESELLEFIQSLSNKNAQLQTEKQELTKDNEKVQLQVCKLEQKYKEAYVKIHFWEEKSKSESKIALEEKDKYLKEISNLKTELTMANQKVIDFDDQIYSLNKRHKAHIKDLSRQLTRSGSMEINKASFQQENFKIIPKTDKMKTSSYSTSDEKSTSGVRKKVRISQTSTTNHNDLEELVYKVSTKVKGDTVNVVKSTPVFRDKQGINKFTTTTLCQTPEIHMIEPQNQILIEKIVKLQRINAKYQDKIDFLSEHTLQLTQEIQKKSFLLKYLFSEREEKGSVKSDTIDENHFMMSKKGGIMASVYSSRAVDESMTLDLSLEISRRLQSVLEDTTIKNITLKESINTLGEEISRLNEENRSLKKQMESS